MVRGTPRVSGLKWLLSACAKPRSIDRSHLPKLILLDVRPRYRKFRRKINTVHTVFAMVQAIENRGWSAEDSFPLLEVAGGWLALHSL